MISITGIIERRNRMGNRSVIDIQGLDNSTWANTKVTVELTRENLGDAYDIVQALKIKDHIVVAGVWAQGKQHRCPSCNCRIGDTLIAATISKVKITQV